MDRRILKLSESFRLYRYRSIKCSSQLRANNIPENEGFCGGIARCKLIRASQKSERLRSLLLSLGVPSRPSPGSDPGPVQVPSRLRRGPIQIRHVLCFTAFRTHPGPEVGAIRARPGPILLPSVPPRVGPGRAETDFLATSEKGPENRCRAKILKKCRKIILTFFWRFLTFFVLREKGRKRFWHFLTVFVVAPFRWPLLRSAELRISWKNRFWVRYFSSRFRSSRLPLPFPLDVASVCFSFST